MKVRILRDGLSFKRGEVVDLHDGVARAWIKSGLAEAVERVEKAPQPTKSTPASTKDYIPLNKRKKV